MKLFLFRHAEKELSHSFSSKNNPPLSANGHRQAISITNEIEKLSLIDSVAAPAIILSSPKLRAVQTLTPLSKRFEISIQETDALLERRYNESEKDFFLRVKTFIFWVPSLHKTTYLVTHFDWLETAMMAIPCDINLNSAGYFHWTPAQNMEFNIQNNLWTLIKSRESKL